MQRAFALLVRLLHVWTDYKVQRRHFLLLKVDKNLKINYLHTESSYSLSDSSSAGKFSFWKSPIAVITAY